MLTCREYLELFPDRPPEEIHVHGLDLLQHCLRGDVKETWYKDRSDKKTHLYELQEELEKHTDNDELNNVLNDVLTQKPKWTRYDSEDGDLDIDRYIQTKDNPDGALIYDGFRKEMKPKPAMTLILDCAIPYMERSLGDMAHRHKLVYTLATQAYMEGRPCRVIATWGVKYTEESLARVFFITIKDFSEPMFSGMWGAFKNNRTTNCLLNVIMDYFIGTDDYGNGRPVDIGITQYIPRLECELIDPKRLYY